MLNVKSLDLRSRLASDAGENSIMQTITIAVSAILIAAGLITAPGLINNARDNNARGDLSNLAYAQEYAAANSTGYATDLQELTDMATLDGGIKFTQSDGVAILVVGSPASYDLYAISQSGKVFLRSADSTATALYGTVTKTGSSFSLGSFTPENVGDTLPGAIADWTPNLVA